MHARIMYRYGGNSLYIINMIRDICSVPDWSDTWNKWRHPNAFTYAPIAIVLQKSLKVTADVASRRAARLLSLSFYLVWKIDAHVALRNITGILLPLQIFIEKLDCGV